MKQAIDLMREAFIALSSGRAEVPVRASLPTANGVMLYMPAYIFGEPISAVKIVSVYPNNPNRNLPTVNASVLAFDAVTGLPAALMDGTTLTAIRTGAGAGLATDLLAREDSHILGVIGAGAQARTQIEAVCAVRDIQQIRIYSPHSAPQFVADLRDQYAAEMIAVDSAKSAVRDADIIVTATNSHNPVVHRADIKPGVHINGVGSFTPEMQEIAADIVARARIVVDHRESAWEEAGDLIIPRDQGLITEQDAHDEIGEVAIGKAPGRTAPDQITFFKSVGNAVQDAVTARYVVHIAERDGLGTVVDM
jgi:ornithine cyclodeaminase